MAAQIHDLVVIGGGINGAGIAADAAGRGLQVALCDMNDLASATSSRSSKLIHGGLRYLEYGEFRLVREALAEREVLLRKAPHIIRPLRFRLPHSPGLRAAWLIRAGLFLYDHLARRSTLPASTRLRFDQHSPLRPQFRQGFEYSDARVDDARLVVLNALAARQQGAEIRPRWRCIQAQRKQQLWELTLQQQPSGTRERLRCRALVNAAGPWAARISGELLAAPASQRIRLVQGSHIIVPRLHPGPEAYLLQLQDGRILFVIPYESQFSLIGTTDVEYNGDPAAVSIGQAEIDYLLDGCNQYFKQQLKATDIISSYAGVRPLLEDEASAAQAVSRDYRLVLDAPPGQAPLLSVFGGKITTYRKLAEAAMDQLCPFFPGAGPAWTEAAPLPGGDFTSLAQLQQELTAAYTWLPAELGQRYARSYGTRYRLLLRGCDSLAALGHHFGAGLYAREVDYLVQQEWAQTAEDILWRRSKLGLYLQPEAVAALTAYLSADL